MAVATELADAVGPFVSGDLPVRLVAWDGSEAGPADAPVVELRSPDAVRRLLWHPGELGAAQAYVTGELEVPGDLDAALTHAFAVARSRGLPRRPSPGALVRALEVRGVQALREHYVTTVAGWLANFEAHLPELTDLVGEEVVRVWRLYLVGGSMAFRDGRMGVDQILMERAR